MKFAFNLILVLAMLFNQAIVSRPVSYAPVRSQAQAGIETPVPTPGASAYPPPVSAPPTPIPTSIPTVVPPVRPMAAPAPAARPTPVQTSRLSLKTNLNCTAPGEDLSLDWDFQPAPEWAGRENALELVLSLPAAFAPDSKGLTHFDAQSGAARLPLSKTGKLQGKLAPQERKTAGVVTIAAKVVSGEKVIAAATLQVGPGNLFEIAANGGEAVSPGRQIKVSFPEGALKEDVAVCIREIASSNHAAPLFGGRSFEIEARSKSGGAAVKQFARDLEIVYPYDPAEIGVDEASLSLVYYDEAAKRWKYVASTVDTTRHVITASSNHLTEFNYDLNSVDKYRIQDFSAFQVSEYSGAASYSYPLTVPPGPGGLAPNLTLTYSSSISDSAGPHSQASWVGMGWELNPGAISRNTNGTLKLSDDTFSLQLSGQGGGTLLPIRTGTDTTADSDTYNKAYVEYESQDAAFLRVRRYDGNGGGCPYTCDTSFWRVWDQNGTIYTFAERQIYHLYLGSGAPPGEVAKWPLTQIKSVSGQTIDYSYTPYWAGRDGNGGGYEAYDVLQLVLHEIRYANNHYLIHFDDEARGDVEDECEANDAARCAVDIRRLDAVSMYYNPDGDAALAGLEQIRRYDFTYVEGGTTGVFPNTRWKHENGVATGYTPTLVSIREYGLDDDHYLPAMTFTYDGMHLKEASNGYNGKIHFEYEITPWPNGAPLWANGTAAGTPLKFWQREYIDSSEISDGGNILYTGIAKSGASLPTGRNIWMQIDVGSSTNGSVLFSVANSSTVLVVSPSIPTTNGSGMYSAILTLPLGLLDDTQYSLMYQCAKPCSIDSIQYGSVSARYRVTQKWIYPDASLDAYDVYQYQYSGPAMNDASLSSVTPASDFTAEKVITAPYTELRGHAQVTMTGPDGSYTRTNFHQTDRLAGKVSSSAGYAADNHKLSETLYTYGTPVELPVSTTASAYLPKYGDNLITKVDAKIWWTPLVTVEKRIYASNGVDYIATKTDTSYVLDGNGKPVYGEVRSVVESENNSSGSGSWTVVRKKFSTYTATDVPAPGASNDLRYFVGHPSSTAVCSPNGSATNAEYQICGSSANDYYGFTSYTYNEKGQVSTVSNLLYLTGAPTAAYINGYSDFTQYTYDSYGNAVTVGQGYKAANAAGVVQKTTTSCYLAETSDRSTNPPCDPYTGVGVNGVYLSWVKNPLNKATHYVNDARLGQPTKQIDANLAEISVTYDSYGRLSTVRKPGDDGTIPTLQFAYHIPDANSKFFWSEAAQKLDESHTYSVRKFYNGIGELIQTQQVGVKVSDAACSTETCTVVSDQKTEYVNGVKTTTQSVPYARATPAGYVAPDWQNLTVTVTTYDAQGRPQAIRAPGQTEANKQSFSYDVEKIVPDQAPLWQKTTATDPQGNSTKSWKDAWGRTLKVQPATGPALRYEYDLANRLKVVQQVGPDGAAFATTLIEYDVAGRKLNMTDPDMGKWYYAYDAQGNLTRQTDAKGQRICLYYDVLNRLTDKYYPNINIECPTDKPAPQDLNVRYSYDAYSAGPGPLNWGTGRRTGMVDASGTTAWSYDQRGRVTSETRTVKDGATVLGTYTTLWTYTSADRIATMIYPKGSSTVTAETVTYDYRPQGTLTSLTSSYNQTYLSGAWVDAAGRPTLFELGNGTQTKHTYYPWDPNSAQSGRLQKLQSGSPDSLLSGAMPNLQSFEYSYDWAGNIASITQKVGDQNQETLNYTYDEINRLTSENNSANPSVIISSAYSADTGNLTSKGGPALGYGAQAADCPTVLPGTPAKAHAATSRGSDSYCYDENGNMTRRTISTGTYTLSYDPENRLTQISGGSGPTYNYVYDGDGQRVLVNQSSGDKTIYIGGHFEVFIKAGYTSPGAPPARNCGAMRCIFLPSVATFINPPATAGQVWKSYYSTGSGRAMRVQDNAGTGGSGIFWLYADHLGSTTLTTSLNSMGSDLVSTLSYTAWGETRASSGTTPTSLRYTGQREAEAGLYFYQARWYDPALGRFAQADTIVPDPGSAIGWDRYVYVRNNPVNFTDPSGHIEACEENCRSVRNYTSDEKRWAIKQMAIAIKREGGDSLVAFADLLTAAGKLYRWDDTGSFMSDVTCVINGYCKGLPVDVWQIGLRVGQSDSNTSPFLGFNFFTGYDGWAYQYNDFTENQMYHFWFYVDLSYWDGSMIANEGNALHDPGYDTYVIIEGLPIQVGKASPWATPGSKSGQSQQDFLLGKAGINLGQLLSAGKVSIAEVGRVVKDYLGKQWNGLH